MKIHMSDCVCMVYKLVFARLSRFFQANGHAVVEDPAEADIHVVGLCASFEADEDRSVELVEQARRHGGTIYAYGCMVRVRPERLGEVRMFAADQARALAEAVVPQPDRPWEDVPLPSEFRCRADYRKFDPAKRYVGISTGCGFECSYCPHKLGTGDIVSVPLTRVVEEVARLSADPDIKLLTMTGIDTACWGAEGEGTFAELLEAVLATARADMSVHVAQFNPEGLATDTDRLARCLADARVTELQMPVQTSSPRLLALMNRHYDPARVAEFLARLRRTNPRLLTRTDLMVGFPTETEDELCAAVDYAAAHFDEVAVYGFEMKRDTPIASAGLETFDRREVERRRTLAYDRLRAAGRLVHSGGQLIETLIANDDAKEASRRRTQGTIAP